MSRKNEQSGEFELTGSPRRSGQCTEPWEAACAVCLEADEQDKDYYVLLIFSGCGLSAEGGNKTLRAPMPRVPMSDMPTLRHSDAPCVGKITKSPTCRHGLALKIGPKTPAMSC